MKTINILCVALIALCANAHRHHRHSNFEQTAFSEIESMFKLMNNFNSLMAVPEETETVRTMELTIPERPSNVNGE